MKTGIELIAAERQRQIEVEGFTAEKDDLSGSNQFALAAACYALPERTRNSLWMFDKPLIWHLWPWLMEYWKPTPDNRIQELTKAGALIAAEIDRLNRKDKNK